MDDLGVQYTDKKVEALEKKLEKAYKQASKEIGEKLKDFTEKSAAKESKYLQMVKDGTMTQDAFDKWKQGQVFYGDAWKSQQQNMAKVLADTNKTATAWINGEKADVFAFNGNYTAYDMEHGFGVNFGFDLYSEDSVKHLLKDNPKILPKSSLSISKDEKWNMRNIRSQITQGILQGESIPKIADRLANLIPERNRNQMVLHARTAMTSAQNAGRQERYKEAEALGIKFKKVWLATLDARTRETHQDADGQAVRPDEDFVVGGEKLAYPGDPSADPAETYNCFVGETNVVTNCNVERVYRHKYEGQLISIKTAGGVNFTCTPNHPILTRRGWIHAQFLNKGDDIVVTFRSHDWFSWIDPNINHRFPRFDTLFKLFDKMGGKRTCALGVDFHGDISTSNVEIITQERLLGDNGNPGKFKKESKLGFVLPDKSLACNSTPMKHFRSIFCSSFCFIRRFCKMLSFFWRGLTHSEIHSLRPIALFDSCGIKPWNDSCSCDAKLLGELLDGFSGIVCGDKIVNIDICSSNCHVYNLQSKHGYYFVNSISQNESKYNGIVAIAKNCRCTMVTELDDYPSSFDRRAYDTDDSGHRESYITKNTTYNDWYINKTMNDPSVKVHDLQTVQSKLQKQIDKLDAKNHTLDGVWYNQSVSYADYQAKKDSIPKKKQYYEDQINKLKQSGISTDYYEQKLKELEDFEKNGKKWSEYNAQLKDVNKQILTLKPPTTTGTFSPDAYSQQRLDGAVWAKSPAEADDVLRKKCGEVWRSATDEEKAAIYDYTMSYHKFNEPLRGIEYGTSEFKGVGNTDLNAGWQDNGRQLNAMTDLIDKSASEQDMWFQRGVRFDGMEHFFDCDKDLLMWGSQDQLEQELLGKVVTEHGFMSCGSSKGTGFSGDMILNIYTPQGTKMMYVEPFSHYGAEMHDYSWGSGLDWDGIKKQNDFGTELETILQQGTSFTVEKIEKTYDCIYFDLYVHDQNGVQRWEP